MVIAATQAAAGQQWAAVAAVDEQLAQVPATAQWAPQAQRLRAEWRMRVNNRELRQRYGDEGIAIADFAEVNFPDVVWHALRAQSAAGTNRPEVMIESTASFCTAATATKATLAVTERQQLRALALDLQQRYRQLPVDGQADGARYLEIRERLETTIKSLE